MVEPETRPSLMLRLRDPCDQQAWEEFVAIYESLLLRLLRSRGLQQADAQDVTQQVIVAVMQAVSTWRPDGRDASFRRWLFGIARRLAVRAWRQATPINGPACRGMGGTAMLELLNNLPDSDDGTSAAFDQEYRTALFQWAADRVRHDFRESTWQAFWQTCVLNRPIAQVGDELHLSVGSIYVARSRVIARLRQFLEDFEVDYDH